MLPSAFRTVRYTRAWITGSTDCLECGVDLDRGDTTIPATLARPRAAREPLPAWVVLHGVTRLGRSHEQLARFTRALVSSGAVAIVPEVPEWREFSLAPQLAVPTLKAAIEGLAASQWTRRTPVGVIGFSFGAPHAIAATAHPSLQKEVAGSVAFGGYCDLERTIRFLMTGTHEWSGRRYHMTPDPYGRWIVASNYLTGVPGHSDASDVAAALRSLAAHAGESGLHSLDSRLDARKAELRRTLARERRSLFDLFAPGSDELPDPTRADAMAAALARAARAADAAVELKLALSEVGRPVHVLHGRRDNLIPFSESLRLQASLPPAARSRATITRLFGHSRQDALPSVLRTARELPAFFRALRRVLRLV